jgi:hypothetical protein
MLPNEMYQHYSNAQVELYTAKSTSEIMTLFTCCIQMKGLKTIGCTAEPTNMMY